MGDKTPPYPPSHCPIMLVYELAEHILNSDHSYKSLEENVTILNYEENPERLLVKEDMFIYIKNKKDPNNILNSMQIKENHPIYEKIIKIERKKD